MPMTDDQIRDMAVPIGSRRQKQTDSAKQVNDKLLHAVYVARKTQDEMVALQLDNKPVPGDLKKKMEAADDDVSRLERLKQEMAARMSRLSNYDDDFATLPDADPDSGRNPQQAPDVGRGLRALALAKKRGGRFCTQEDQACLQRLNWSSSDGEIDVPLTRDMYKLTLDRTAGTGLEWTAQDLYMRQVMKEMELISSVRARARKMPTAVGGKMHLPIRSNLSRKAQIVAPGGDWDAAADVKVDSVSDERTLDEYKYVTSTQVYFEQIRDNLFPLEAMLVEDFAEGHGRAQNEHFTTGSGSGEPQGFVTWADANTNAEVELAAADAITFDDVIDLEHALDPIHRGMGAAMMCNDAILKLVRKIRTDSGAGAGTGDYIWEPSQQVGQPGTIHGVEVLLNQDMAAVLTTGTKGVMAYGLFGRNYVVRDVGSVRFKMLDQAEWKTDEIVYVSFWTLDAGVWARSGAGNTRPEIVILNSP